MDVIKTYIPKRFRNKKLVNTGGRSGSTTVINSGSDISPSSFVDSDTFYSMFELVDLSGTPAIKAKHEFFSVAGVTAYGTGTVATGGSGSSVSVLDVLNSTDTGSALSANMGRVLNEGKLNRNEISSWAFGANKPAYSISEITGLSASLSGKSAVGHGHTISEISDFAHVHTKANITDFPTSMPASDVSAWAKASTKPSYVWSEIGSKPTTLSEYGITDALLKSDINVQVGGTKNSQMLWTSWDNSNAYGGAIQIREYGNVNNTQSDWYYSPAITFHWSNRSVKRFGMRSDGQLAIDDSPILWSGNYSAYALPLSGGTMTGNLTMGATTDIITNFKTWTKDNSKSLKSFLDKFDIDANGNLVVKTNLYSTGEVTAYSSGTGVSGLKLMGDMNANGKSITGALQIYGGNAYLGNVGINPSLQWSYEGDENTMAEYNVLTGEYKYAGNQVKYLNNILTVTGQVASSEFKFGNYSFKQSANGLSICFNGVEQAYITSTGQYVNS